MKQPDQIFVNSLLVAALAGALHDSHAAAPAAEPVKAAPAVQAAKPAPAREIKAAPRSRAEVKAEAVRANKERRSTFAESQDILKK